MSGFKGGGVRVDMVQYSYGYSFTLRPEPIQRIGCRIGSKVRSNTVHNLY